MVDAAVVGIIGVGAGALATSGTELWIRSRQRRNDALAACRLTWGALESALAVLNGASEGEGWGVGADGIERSLAVWHDNRIAAARSVDALGYRVLEVAFVRLSETLQQAGSFDDAGLQAVIGDPRLPEDLIWMRKAKAVALRGGQTGWQRLRDTRRLKKLQAEVEAELSSAENVPSKSPDEAASD